MQQRGKAGNTRNARGALMVAACLWAGSAGATPITGPTALTVFSGSGAAAVIDLTLSATGSIYIDFSAAGVATLNLGTASAPGTVSIDTGNGAATIWPHAGTGTQFATDSAPIDVTGDVLLTPSGPGLGGTWDNATLNLTAGADIFLWNLGDGLVLNVLTSGGGTGGGLGLGGSITIGSGGGGTTVGPGGGVVIGGGGVVIGGGGATLSLPAPATLPLALAGLMVLASCTERRRRQRRRQTRRTGIRPSG